MPDDDPDELLAMFIEAVAPKADLQLLVVVQMTMVGAVDAALVVPA